MNLLRLPLAFFLIPSRLLRFFYSQLKVYLTFPGLRVGVLINWRINDFQFLSIGNRVWIGPFSDIDIDGKSQKSSISGELEIHDDVVIGAFANIRAGGGKITIGKGALLAQHISLIGSNHILGKKFPPTLYRDAPWDEQITGVTIGMNVWLGAGVIVLPGAVIGANSVVGAGSVVKGVIPPNCIVAGNPAKFIRSL